METRIFNILGNTGTQDRSGYYLGVGRGIFHFHPGAEHLLEFAVLF